MANAASSTGTKSKQQKGNKNRKYGRKGRSNAQRAYNLGRRWEVNKEKRIAKDARVKAKVKARKLDKKIVRGATRKIRRMNQPKKI